MNRDFLPANASDVSTNECQSALDCTFNSSDGSFKVLKLCYIGVRDYNFCDCSSWYGFTGVDCNQPSVQTRYYTSSLVFFLVVSIILLMFSLFELARHIWFIYTNPSRKAKLNVGLALLAANVGGALSVMIYSIVKLRALIDPSKFELVQYKTLLYAPTIETTVEDGNLANAGLILANEFFIVAAMQISLSWIDLAVDVWSFFDERQQKKVKRIKRFIQILTVISLCSVLIFLMARLFYAATFIAIINAILLLILFIYGRWVFLKLVLGIFQEELKESIMKVVVTVKHSSLLHIICLGGLILLLTLFYVCYGTVYENIPVGGFNSVLLLNDLSLMLGTILLVADTYYVHNLFNRLLISTGGKPSATGSSQIGKNRSRNDKHAEGDSTVRSLNNAGVNDIAVHIVKNPELPITAGLVRSKATVSVSVSGIFDDQSNKKPSIKAILRTDWEV